MNDLAMGTFGRALRAFTDGDESAELIIRRDDGLEVALPVAYFFRSPDAFTPIEMTALLASRAPVLDVGAGSGLHTCWLQDHGFEVTAIDISRIRWKS